MTTQRPDTRGTKIVWWLTVLVMAIITVVLLLAYAPWDDPVPGQHKTKTTNQHLDTGKPIGPSATSAR